MNKKQQKKKQTKTMEKTKTIIRAALGVIAIITFLIVNPFSWNDGGQRTVVQTMGGDQFVRFTPGIFFAGFFSKETQWPNQISVTYMQKEADLQLRDNGVEVGYINVMFSDGTTADVKGITQFILPSDEHAMISLHNTHRTPESLVVKRLLTVTKECLQSSAQLMSSDKHYGGGRTQMSQDFIDQLKEGIYLANIEEKVFYDSIDQERKRTYLAEIRRDKTTNLPLRKNNSLKEFEISVADASIIDTDYSDKVDQKLEKIIDAATKSAVSRQELMTAQQQTLTEKAKGEQELVKIEYEQKQDQTKQVVAAQTKVAVAEQDKLQQKIAYEGAILEAKKIKELADARAYEKKRLMDADGALEQKLAAWKFSEEKKWDAFGKFTGQLVPNVQTGGAVGPNSNALNYMELLGVKAAKDLSLDLKTNK